MPHDAHPTGEKPIRSWHGDTEARRREGADQRPQKPTTEVSDRGRRFPTHPLDPQFCWNLETNLGKFRDYARISLTERDAVDQTIAIVRRTRYARPEDARELPQQDPAQEHESPDDKEDSA